MTATADDTAEDATDQRLLPLTAAQKALWFAQQALGEIPLAIAQYIDISGDLDAAAVRAATEKVGRTLGTTISRIADNDGRPGLILDPSRVTATFEALDLRADTDPVAAAHSLMSRWCRAPLSLDSDGMVRTVLLHIGDHRWFLFSRAHHIVLDGFGAYILLMRVADEYQQMVDSESVARAQDLDAITAVELHTAVIDQERTYRASSRYERDRDYWSTVMSALPGPVSLARATAAPTIDPIRVTGPLGAEVNSALDDAATRRKHDSTVLIVAALSLYMARATGQSVVALSLPVAARVTGRLRRSAGSVSNLVPIVIDVRDTMTLDDLAQAVSGALIGALRHQMYRYEQMFRDQGSGMTGISHVGPVLNIFPEQPPVTLGGGMTADYHVLTTGPVADLNVNIYQSGKGGSPTIDLEANPNRYERSTVEQHRDNLINLIDAVCRNPGTEPVGRITIPAVTHADGPSSQTPVPLADLLARHRDSGRRALVDGDSVLSHRDLAAAAGRLADALRARGIGPEDRVAVMLSRGIDEVIAFHAVAAAGACYVPVDPRYPRSRRKRIVAESGAAIILWATDTPAGESPEDVVVENVSDMGITALNVAPLDVAAVGRTSESETPTEGFSSPGRSVSLERAAYVIFTAGSTGSPKGVVVTDTGLTGLCAEIERSYDLSPDAVVAHMSSTAFDTSIVEMLAAAVSGATLVVVPETVYGGAELARYLTDQGVTHVMLTPGVLATLDPDDIPTVTHLIVGGDVCPPDVVRPFAERTVLRSAYGPTETTCSVVMTEPLDPRAMTLLPLPIGRPMSGVRVQVRDRFLRPVPLGIGGDLYVGGPALARGYLTDSSLTATCFVADPTSADGARMYRTGDRAAWRCDGSLDFLGRTDHQVKIRGIRVDPAEVDAALRAQPGVAAAITVAVPHRRSHLLASYVAAGSTSLSISVLRGKLAAELPAHLVPSSIAVLDAIPMTASGKVDRAALPPPSYVATAPYRCPDTAEERLVAHAFADATGVGTVGVDDDFFELGGDSLTATTLVSAVNASSEAAMLTVRDVFEWRTPAALARRLGCSGGATMPHHEESPGPHALAPAQRNVDLSGPVVGALIPFTVSIGTELDPDLLGRAVNTVVTRHAMLRSRLVETTMVVDAADATSHAVIELVDSGPAIDEFLCRPMSLEVNHPIRWGVRIHAGTTVIAICAHHLFVDGWSLGIIARDLMAAYAEAATGAESHHAQTSRQPLNYLDYAAWAREHLGDAADPMSLWQRNLEFWRSELDSFSTPFDIPSDRARPTPWAYEGARIRFDLDDLWPGIRAVAAENAVSTTTVLRASLARLLCRRSASDAVAIGGLTSGRLDNRLDDVVGMFVNTVAVVCAADDGDAIAHLADIAAAELRAYAHADIPMADVARELWSDSSAHPLFQVMLTIENSTPTADFVAGAAVDGLEVTPRPPAIAKCDLHIAVTAGDSGFVEVLYPVSMWDEATVGELIGAWFDDVRRYPDS